MLKLERLELHGFKSFHDRTEVQFDQAVTAVVGPNGCGKSNILDAMTWVLGEQSIKSLRGSAFEDLIFNGSERKRPLGMAEVTLRLRATNGDLPHGQGAVDVTRRLFRSGESEYLLNGTACRLKDIHDVLYGSGLGVKAYSFIEQGKIGAILQARPLDRRALIEEAAGITKFRAKKREAELKLEAAEQNLVRVRDIVAEVEKQLGSLKRQASRARRYERVRAELSATLRRLYATESVSLRRHERDARERLDTESARRQHLIAAVGVAESDVEGLRAAIEKNEDGTRGTAEHLHETELEVDRSRHLIVNGRERIDDLERRGRELGEALAANLAREDEMAQGLARKRGDRVAAEQREATLRETLSLARGVREQAERVAAEADAELEAQRSLLLDAVHRLAAASNTLVGRERVLESLGARRERLRLEERRVEDDRAERRELAAAVQDRVEGAERQVEERGTSVREALGRAEERGRERDQTRGRCEELRRVLHGKEERARLSASLMGSSEDGGEAARAAAELLGESAHGLVADFLQVELRLEPAVEAALEPVLGALVVSGEEAAAAALHAASSAGRGCLRLILAGDTPADGSAPPEGVRPGEEGVVGRLTDLVRVAPEMVATLGATLDRILVVERLDDALRLRLRLPRWSLVTLAGEVVGADGVLRAGARSPQGLLALRREARELHEEVERLGLELVGLEEALAQAGVEVARAEAEAQAAVASLHEAEKHLLRVRHELVLMEEEERKRSESLAALGLEREEVEREIAEGEQDRERERREREDLEAARALVEARIGSCRRQVEEARGAVQAAVERTAGAESDLARAEEVTKAVGAELHRLEEAAAERAAAIAALRDEERGNGERRQALLQEIDAAEEALTGALAEVAALQDRLRGEEEEGRRLRHELSGRENGLKDLRLEAELQRERVQAIEIERTRIEGEIGRLSERCREDLGVAIEEVEAAPVGETPLPPSAIDAELDDEALEGPVAASEAEAAGGAEGGPELAAADLAQASLEQLRQAASALKLKLQRIGPVNVLAIDEYQELKSRHDFLSTQAQDLTESIESLVATITRINRTSRERFEEAFQQINRNFQENFVQLFGGGRAELRLTDEENLLETGIDIVAQPPGKRLQNILLLSGGEKALAAISLLFALFRFKPSPFCILDEVDAPLDEKNIDRFLGLLRSLATSTQFILITHSPRTMKVADALYGVTMEEPGVSRLVSVKLVA